jgi:hypothetical protein
MVDVKELRNHSNVTFEYVLVFFIISIFLDFSIYGISITHFVIIVSIFIYC